MCRHIGCLVPGISYPKQIQLPHRVLISRGSICRLLPRVAHSLRLSCDCARLRYASAGDPSGAAPRAADAARHRDHRVHHVPPVREAQPAEVMGVLKFFIAFSNLVGIDAATEIAVIGSRSSRLLSAHVGRFVWRPVRAAQAAGVAWRPQTGTPPHQP